MKKYVLKRFLASVLTLLVLVMVLFILMELMPGSPFNDEKLSPVQIERTKELYGLDDPLPTRFVNYIAKMLSGNFGVSYAIAKNVPVTALLKKRLPVSAFIGLQAVMLGTALGILLGAVAACRHNTLWDRACTVLSVLGVSLPSYVIALSLSYIFGFKFGWFSILYQADSVLWSSVLPVISLSFFVVANVARFTRSEMLEVLDSEYIMLAESKGVSGARLITHHVMRNAIIPVITVLSPLIVGLMTGSLVIENIFSIPGIGSLLITAIQSNDYNVVMALAFVYSAMYIGIMFFADILYGLIDPRIRVAKENSE
jgi:oligopeptide transport system permease protein